MNLFLLFIPEGRMGGLRSPQPAGQVGWRDGENLSGEKSGQWDPGFSSPDEDKSYYAHCLPSLSPPVGRVRWPWASADGPAEPRACLRALPGALSSMKPFLPEPSPLREDIVQLVTTSLWTQPSGRLSCLRVSVWVHTCACASCPHVADTSECSPIPMCVGASPSESHVPRPGPQR